MSLTRERLQEVLRYDNVKGIFTCVPSKDKNLSFGDPVFISDSGEGFIAIDNSKFKASELAWLWMTGDFPTDTLEYADGNKSNVSWKNLKVADKIVKATSKVTNVVDAPVNTVSDTTLI